MRRFLRPRFLIAYAVVAVLAGAGAVMWVRASGPGVQYRTAPVTLGTVTQTVALAGNLASAAETNLSFSTSGMVQTVDVVVGQSVVNGAKLASLDNSTAQEQLATAEATLSSAQARLSLDEAGPTAQELASGEAQVSTGQVALQNSETSLTDTTAINQQAIAQATSTLQSAQAQESSDCGATPSSKQCATDQQTVAQDGSALQATTLRAQQADDQARGQVDTVRVQLQNAEAALSALRQGTTPQQIQMDQSQVQIASISVQAAQTTVGEGTLTSPATGVVAEVNIGVGQQVGGSGGASAASNSTSSSSTPDIVIVTPGQFDVTGSVSDATVQTIAVGQQADVTPAGSQEALTGHVTQVAQVATISSGVATFPVTVLLDQPDPALRVGMSASVQVVVNRVVQVLTVPTSAVHSSAAGTTVQVLVNGSPQTRSVQVGAQDATRTQILSGVSLGDQIVIATITGTVPAASSGGGGFFGGGGRGAGGGLGGGGRGNAAG